jgi:predicted membrane protein
VRAGPAWRARADAAARTLSLILATATAAALIAAPFVVGRQMTSATHAVVSLLLLGMSAGFVHGLGMRPEARIWRVAFSPWTAWPLICLGWIALLARS